MDAVQPRISFIYIYYKQQEKPDLVGVLERKCCKTIFRLFSQISWDLHIYMYCNSGKRAIAIEVRVGDTRDVHYK